MLDNLLTCSLPKVYCYATLVAVHTKKIGTFSTFCKRWAPACNMPALVDHRNMQQPAFVPLVSSPPFGLSTLIMSAPRSPSTMVQYGPANTRLRSRIRMPWSGKCAVFCEVVADCENCRQVQRDRDWCCTLRSITCCCCCLRAARDVKARRPIGLARFTVVCHPERAIRDLEKRERSSGV